LCQGFNNEIGGVKELGRTISNWDIYWEFRVRKINDIFYIDEERRLRVFGNRVLRGIFEPNCDNVTGDLRKRHNEELHDLYSSPNIVRVIEWRRMRWTGHVARTGRREVCMGFWWGT
jgi:hypothetical protein